MAGPCTRRDVVAFDHGVAVLLGMRGCAGQKARPVLAELLRMERLSWSLPPTRPQIVQRRIVLVPSRHHVPLVERLGEEAQAWYASSAEPVAQQHVVSQLARSRRSAHHLNHSVGGANRAPAIEHAGIPFQDGDRMERGTPTRRMEAKGSACHRDASEADRGVRSLLGCAH